MELQRSELKKYLKIITKRKYLFILLSLIIMSVIAWGSYFLPKQYEASSLVFIEQSLVNQLVRGIAITPSINDKIRVLRYEILSRDLLRKALRDIDADVNVKNDRQFEELIQEFRKKTNITVNRDDLFIVSLRDQDPQFAMNYVNSLVRNYVERNQSAKREEAYGATRFFTEQILNVKTKLDKAEDDLIKYRQQEGIYLSSSEDSIINDIKLYYGEIDNLKSKRNELSATRESIKKQIAGEEPFTVATLRRSADAGGNTEVLENRIKQLLVRYTENHPEIVKLRADIEELKKQDTPLSSSDSLMEPETSATNPIYQDLKLKLLQTESEINALDAKQKHLSLMISKKERELKYIPESRKKLSELERERNAHRSLYNQLLERQGKTEVAKDMELESKSTTFRVVDPAVLPTKPASPDRVKIILMGIAMGILGGIGGVFLREHFDSSVKDAQTLKDLGLVMLAVIPKIFNEDENKVQVKRARMIYSLAGFYFLIICSALVLEILGYSYIDSMFDQLRIHDMVKSVSGSMKGIF